jgi:hypothetical protein
MLLYFAQFTAAYARDSAAVETPELLWQIRCDGQPRDPYLKFDRIINPWGMAGFPIGLRLEQGCTLELAVRNVSAQQDLGKVGGRLLGRYWYNAAHGGVSGRL